ncbi:glutamyl-tRNA(Gln) amidotransferase subunit C, mitochondrial [Bombina bombina]|uniref:glutamyl-tRNA(Gln) amidotransferase subunit C, mitochondrial n=1 Tax=Bombina bombina TaxID=8345 RepID=UPI00235B0808|nr:glutamyl-tRNA(Gln) amidotransferase subunit C, mitochondrial [Bombina bombina]
MWRKAVVSRLLDNLCRRYVSVQSKVPQKPTWSLAPETTTHKNKITADIIDHLERLALVDFRNEEGVQRLKNAVQFADQLHCVNTDGVPCLVSVLEERAVYIRTDTVNTDTDAVKVLENARIIIEEYFVAPPGNIPLPTHDPRI